MVRPPRRPATFQDLAACDDPDRLEILLVHRWSPDGYIVVQRAAAGETVRPEPFDALELRVSVLFDDDND